MFDDDEKRHSIEADLQRYGQIALPAMEALPNKLNNLISAMLCTPEGFNVCAIGFENEKVAKMAAVSSSLYAMAKSVLTAFSEKKDSTIDTISIHSHNMDILGKKIDIEKDRSLILIIASKKTQPGLQLYAARSIEQELQKQH